MKFVFQLQKNIYQASKQNEIIEVRKIQRSLLNSSQAKLLATRRVTQDNTGKKTAGIDGVKSLKPNERLELAENLKLDTKGMPVRRV